MSKSPESSRSIQNQQSSSRANVLGVGISPVTIQTTADHISKWIETGNKNYICLATVHTINASLNSPALKQALNNSGLTVPDGMPLVWLCKRAGFPQTQRVYGPDLMLALCNDPAIRNYRHFFYGGHEGVAQELAGRLTQRFPGLNVCGTLSPPMLPPKAHESAESIKKLNDTFPDIIWVGLGSPKQDYWMAQHVSCLNAPVLIGVGAAFDFHTGRVRQAPEWMQSNGLEWLFRLSQEPHRLWRRYIIGNPRFLYHLFWQQLGLRQYER